MLVFVYVYQGGAGLPSQAWFLRCVFLTEQRDDDKKEVSKGYKGDNGR